MLVDEHSRTHRSLRISVMDKCDLRCTYCMPEEMHFLPRKALMTRDEINMIASIFVEEFDINKIRITGGEPLVRHDVVDIIRDLAGMSVKLGLTTNALSLHKHLEALIDAGLDNLNISLDTFNAERFKLMARRDGFDKVWQNVQLAMGKGLHIKLNMVVMLGINDDEVIRFVELTRDHPIHVRFIEFMPFTGNGWGRERVFTYGEMLELIGTKYSFAKLQDKSNSTAKAYQVLGWPGSFAVISTVTEPFCATCDRLRLTAEGKMRNCLFAREETDLLGALRSGKDIRPMIQGTVMRKHERLGGLPGFNDDQHVTTELSSRPMVSIGG